ncbi:LysR family transcriptional regulator [Lysinibacillus capsici]|uniref:LysR family transcriptional regulator n=1 Tax=Lysinibacillus capsici TaxID=2115968 RepID=A0A2X0Z838_9BACI|nr:MULTISPECIES: LysR family transcriptional regulator [Lysinibacillus]KMN36800.1 LysR family transcriptional regulator [Lysinibacillus sp. LK3]MCM0625875.1 LysR family transcriptional regulator [Lysinibacillus sp. OL1_EC]MCR6524683.1 LysR family transcriptional regulator [Lysinibacillus capsici]MCT1540496.1 LysR family transcriptional regulator [Lysinibacillus capsici]MCT1571562.1 LysR family transcriptional regulator [Lysinibacillus capsici]
MIGKLDLYRVFSVVAKNNSFSSAAKDLYMTQPAVSQAMMQLENELGTRLFNRTPKGVTLTTEGSLLFEYTNSALGLLDAGEEKLLEFKNLTTGQLKIGVGDTISRFFLMPYLEAFHTMYPNIKLQMLNGTTSEICNFIKSGEVDIGFCNFPIEDSTLQLTVCTDIQDIFVCGEKYKTLSSKSLSYEDLLKFPLIFLEKKSNSRKYVEDYLFARGVHIEPEFELGSHDLVLEFARSNLGIACVTKEFSKDYLQRGLLYELTLRESIPTRSIGMCYLKSVPLSRAAMKFVEIIESKHFNTRRTIKRA